MRRLVIGAALLGVTPGCGDSEESTPTPTLPPATTPEVTPPDEATPFEPGEIPPGGDQAPGSTLRAEETGVMSLSPQGGPWDAMTGSLTVAEYVDGGEEPTCLWTFALTGTLPEVDPSCPDCDVVVEALHYLGSAEGQCVHADLPADQEIRRLGLDVGEGILYLDYRGTGIWEPWYEAELLGDLIQFSWEATYGYYPPEEEE